MYDLPDFERCFGISIYIYDLQEDGETTILRYKPTTRHNSVMYCNLYEHHSSYIYDFGQYAMKFLCPLCQKLLKFNGNYKRHLSTCD